MEETDEASLFETGILVGGTCLERTASACQFRDFFILIEITWFDVGGLIPRAAISRFEFDFVFAD